MTSYMTWRRGFALLCLLGAAALRVQPLAAQTSGSDFPTLESLKPASAPAFILLNAAPAQISRPNDPADLAASLVSSTNGFSELPRDFALEVSPYWLVNRPTLTWRSDITRTMSQSLRRTFTISAGSAQIGDDDNPRTGLAVGGRALLLSGRVSPEMAAQLTAREQVLAGFSAQIQAAHDSIRKVLNKERTDSLQAVLARTPASRRGFVVDSLEKVFSARQGLLNSEFLETARMADIRKDMNALESALIVREGPMLEIAAGAAWGFDGDVWDTGRLHKVGAWLTYSCEKCRFMNNSAARITPMLVARYLLDADSSTDVGSFDSGGRLAVTANHFSSSVEGIFRASLGSSDRAGAWRIVGTMEYEVQKNAWLVASFGRDSLTPTGRSLVARFGLKLNVVGDRYKEEN